jgi:nucleoside-diphosphate-sugar epimerase
MPERKQAVVVGALGVIGRYIVERLLGQEDWSVIGLSRRPAEAGPRYRHISVDLLDGRDTAATLAGLAEATHVFYAAFQPAAGAAAGYATNIAPNRDMLVNAVTAIDAVSSALRRVVLVTGTKYYGSHLGPFRTPARESDPRHMPPDYYFDQIDWLAGFQRGKRWDWVELRPQTLCGFAPGTPMSLAPAIAVYAAISKELGLPLRFPGKAGAYTSIYQVTESTHFANAALWAASEPRCALEAFNITNGNYFRWQNTVAEARRRLRYAGRRSADDQPHGTHGGQGTAVAGHDREIRAEALCLRRARGLAVLPITSSAATGT